MKFISEIINKIKLLFFRRKQEKLDSGSSDINTVTENVNNINQDILEDSKVIISGFKIDKEVLELALKYEKKKKEIDSKKQELYMLNSEIQYLENNLKNTSKK